jgi:hypothetical protein
MLKFRLLILSVIAIASIVFLAFDSKESKAATLGGYIDAANCDIISGWALDPDTPSTPIDVHIYANGPAGQGGSFVAALTANANRPDVGNHAFGVFTPASLKDGISRTIYIHGIDSTGNGPNALLGGSGIPLQCASPSTPPAPDIKCNGTDACTLSGWASGNLSWAQVPGASACTLYANGNVTGWSGTAQPVVPTGPLSGYSSVAYRLDCSGVGGSASDTVVVTVSPCDAACESQKINAAIQKIGSMYNCGELKPNVYSMAGNVGYSFMWDEADYSFAKLLNEKGCQKSNDEKYITFYVSTVNFPSNGLSEGAGADMEQGWLDYWDFVAKRYSNLGYKIIILPSPYILTAQIDNVDYPTGLRPLVRGDFNMLASEIPVPYRCPNGKTTPIASIYDTRSMEMGRKFYQGLNNFFGKYPAFQKIAVVAPSDFGEFGFPFGVEGRWWQGGNSVGDCYLNGDIFAPVNLLYANYNQKLIDYFQASTQMVKGMMPSKRLMVYLGYGNDDLPRDGFSYTQVVSMAVQNGIEIHSSHAGGLDAMKVPLGKIVQNKPANYPFTIENLAAAPNENTQTRVLSHIAQYGPQGFEFYLPFDYWFLNHLLYSMGPMPNGNYPDKGMRFTSEINGLKLSSLRSSRMLHGYIDVPTNGLAINGDLSSPIGGWGFFEPPYGDMRSYGVRVYAGPLMEGSTLNPDVGNPWAETSQAGMHPEFMRMVASGSTTAARGAGTNDLSRFGLSWQPNLATGKVALRVYMVNTDAQIMAEHPLSPMVINVASRISGSSSMARTGINYATNEVCTRSIEFSGSARDSLRPNQQVPIYVIDEHRGRLLQASVTDANGNFRFTLNVPNTAGEETQYLMPRVYAYTGSDLVGLPMALPSFESPIHTTMFNCDWRPAAPASTVSISANPTAIAIGASSTLTWSSANATACTASGAWTGSRAGSGTQSITPLSTSTYTLTCAGSGGSASASATVTVNLAPPTTPKPVTIVMEGRTGRAASGTLEVLGPSKNLIKSYPFTTNTSGSVTLNIDDASGSLFYKIKTAPYLTRLISGNLSGVTLTFPQLKSGDINQDNIINSLDFSTMNSTWLTSGGAADLNADGIVNTLDFSLMNRNWFARGEE